jgi:hypothetical protein
LPGPHHTEAARTLRCADHAMVMLNPLHKCNTAASSVTYRTAPVSPGDKMDSLL